jgi:hypothetical protein
VGEKRKIMAEEKKAREDEISFKTSLAQLGEVFATLDNLTIPEVTYPEVMAFMSRVRDLYPDRKPPTLYELIQKAKARRAGLAKDGGPVL